MTGKIKIGVSACLLGQAVRYDGGHKLLPLLSGMAGVEFIPVCPEVAAGMGVPREPIHWVTTNSELRLKGRETGQDFTDTLLKVLPALLEYLEKSGISGFVFKSKSPSCGLAGLPVTFPGGVLTFTGSGLFALAFRERFPTLQVVEDTDWEGIMALVGGDKLRD